MSRRQERQKVGAVVKTAPTGTALLAVPHRAMASRTKPRHTPTRATVRHRLLLAAPLMLIPPYGSTTNRRHIDMALIAVVLPPTSA